MTSSDSVYYTRNTFPSGLSSDLLSIQIETPLPPDGWRRTPPAQAFGTGIMLLYGQELAALARDLPGFREGCEVRADYRQINGEWFPIPESVRIT